MAPVASSRTVRRPEASSSVRFAVTTPTTVTVAPSRTLAVAMGSAAGVGLALGEAEADGVGDAVAVAWTSAASRSQSRYPSRAPLCEACWPTIPVNVPARPFLSADGISPADASA